MKILQTLLSAKNKNKNKNSYFSREAKHYVENKELKKQANYCSVLLS